MPMYNTRTGTKRGMNVYVCLKKLKTSDKAVDTSILRVCSNREKAETFLDGQPRAEGVGYDYEKWHVE